MPKYHYLDEFGDVKDGVITLDTVVYALQQDLAKVIANNEEMTKLLDSVEKRLALVEENSKDIQRQLERLSETHDKDSSPSD